VDEYLLFCLGDERYGFPLAAVREVRRPPRLTPLPGVPSWLRGITNLRGQILAVLDLGLGLVLRDEPVVPQGKKCRLVIAREGGIDAAFLVERIEGVVRCDQLGAVPDGMAEQMRRYCLGLLRTDSGLAAVVSPEFLSGLQQQLEAVG